MSGIKALPAAGPVEPVDNKLVEKYPSSLDDPARSLKRSRPDGVKEPSLPLATKPRTTPPTDATDAEVHKRNRDRVFGVLKEYKTRMAELKAAGQRKDDMVAAREFADRGKIPAKRVGHPLGIEVGDRFGCKGEMVVAGVHGSIMSGIDASNGIPYAIVLSGSYEGDDDGGQEFVYSGMGGQSAKSPMDQSFNNPKNRALKNASQSGSMVRVARKQGHKDYVYDGLYTILSAWMEVNPNTGLKVCKYKFRGVPGESKASAKVEVGKLYSGRMTLENRVQRIKKKIFLRAGDVVKREDAIEKKGPKVAEKKRSKTKSVAKIYGYSTPENIVQELENERKKKLQARKQISSFDISGNQERLRIPAFDPVEKQPWIADFEYVTKPAISAAAQALIEDSIKKIGCVTGCQRKMFVPYTKEGFLNENIPEGVFECPSGCTSPTCRRNQVTSGGLQYPLEIFKTKKKGYGVRCSVDIPGGAYICEYVGELITDAEAELVEDDSYLFGLDHFLLMKQAHLNGLEIPCDPKDLPVVPFSDEVMVQDTFHGHFLVMNAHKKGNVGRYINHMCGDVQNLTIQFVLGEGHNSIYHRICFVASCDIPAGTELVYDYGYKKDTVEGRKLECHCGASECRGELL
ncbi:hypothetical protein BSKO_11719 [Bryopsis sp. KO-2023]|nr:hypothetical protein BSKO_11719 [Bryopsis sp. KO-2023]